MQLPLLQVSFPPHKEQVLPPVPQAETALPGLQFLEASQQPEQSFVGHVPPYPSEAPAHFPVQSFAGLQTPLMHL